VTTLITGATGGFARTFVSWLRARSDKPIHLSGRAASDEEGYVTCDLTHPAEVADLIRSVRPSRIFHLAASYADDFDESFAVNAASARAIFDTLLAEGTTARVVLMGSAAEYGVVLADENPIGEDRAPRPVSTYGVTKAIQSQLAHYYAHRHQVDVVVARLFNLIAPGLSTRLFVGRVEAEIQRFKDGEIEAIELGNLENQRDFLEVGRAMELVELIARHGVAGEIYNVGSGRPWRVGALLDQMLGTAGLDRSVVRTGQAGGRSGYDVPIVYADMSKTLALEVC